MSGIADVQQMVSLSIYHPDGGATCLMWLVPAHVAERIRAELGDPDLTQLITVEQMDATVPTVEQIVTLRKDE